MFEGIKSIAKDIALLNKRAFQEYSPIVEGIINFKCRETIQIEQTLDGLLGFCGYKPNLELYRKLCRYYYEIDPLATVCYVQAYREMWDI